ncbi:MAG: sigma-70 family RNA polymerase sigma factor [Proteobacteria bacterium]|nr:sigma-70 family RNA polymerase sigma factor [Pseudomonadota bacterium]
MTDFQRQFELATLPHLPAAYNLARWMLRDPHSADDVVQEAYLRAFRFFKDLRGADARPWLLGIVRNACHDWLRLQRHAGEQLAFDEERDSDAHPMHGDNDPLLLLEQHDEQAQVQARVDRALAALPPHYREVIVLRELEEMPYEDIARVAGIPVGTVMSRLSRARALLRGLLQGEGAAPERRA